MHAIVKSAIQKHLPPALSIALSIGGATWYLAETIHNGFNDMKQEIIQEAREPFYRFIEYELTSNVEILNRVPPGDITRARAESLYILCNSDFAQHMEQLPPNLQIGAKRNCARIEAEYLK